jgi:phenylacetate-CoA ligase
VAEYELTKAFYHTLLETDRLPRSELDRYQAELLDRFLEFAKTNIAFYRDWRLPEAADFASEDWLQVPTINRATLASRIRDFKADRLPPGHGEFRRTRTGGSAGTPMEVWLSQLFTISRIVPLYRMYTTHGVDARLPKFMFRDKNYSARWGTDQVFRKWAFPWLPEDQLGDRIHLDIEIPAREQLDRIAERSPANVNTLPWNILRLGLESRRSGKSPTIPFFFAVGEYLAPEVRLLAEETFGSRVISILTLAEAGMIAIQCPTSERFHIQSELVLAEILDEDGRPCETGEMGELVVTPFYNYAMPLIRYRTGDYVVQGGDCSCGTSLPTIERFAGSKPHLFQYPDGARRLPAIDRVHISELIGHVNWQLVQTGPGQAELRFEQPSRSDLPADSLHAHLLEALDEGWTVATKQVEKIAKTSGGKLPFCVNAMAQ